MTLNVEPHARDRSSSWTEFPPLRLRGVGTADVESVQHFFRRLIWTTGLPAVKTRAYVGLESGVKEKYCYSFEKSSILNQAAIRRLDVLQRLTGEGNLRCGTLWAVSDVVSRNFNLYRDYKRRWCPKCYEEWDEDSSWEPLIWNIDLLRNCPKHSCLMEHACHGCGSHQRNVSDLNIRRMCGRCGMSLAAHPRWVGGPKITTWIDEQVGQLTEYCGTPRANFFSWDDYVSFVVELRRNAGRCGTLVRPMRMLLAQADYRARKTSRCPSLRTLLNLCAIQSISIGELLDSPRQASSPVLFSEWSSPEYMPLPPVVQAERIYLAVCQIERFIVRENISHLHPVELLLKPFLVAKIAVRDASAGLYDKYQSLYYAQDSLERLNSLGKAYRWAMDLNSARARELEPDDLAEIGNDFNVSLNDLCKVFDASFFARHFHRPNPKHGNKARLPDRFVLEWIWTRWSINQ